MMHRALRYLAPVVLTLLFVLIAERGLDFGYHWDEDALINKVEWSITTGGVLLPPTYDWPSATYWMALLALVPEITRVSGVQAADLSLLESTLAREIRSDSYRLRVRRLLLLATALSVVWVFLAGRIVGGGLLEATLAGGIVATAWEPGYHARFGVPDGLLMQFGALTLWCTVMAATRWQSRWPYAAAAAAGLAVGTKYSAFPLLLPLVVLAFLQNASAYERLTNVGRLVGVAVLAFLVTTPGAVFMPFRFAQGLFWQWTHYQTGHGVYTVAPGFDHLSRTIEYLGLVMLSPYAPLASLLALLAVAGVVSLARSSPRVAIAVALFPIAYVALLSMQRVMVVRNLIILAPFLAVAAARGAMALADVARYRYARPLMAAAVALAIVINAVFGVRAAESIRARHQVTLAQVAQQWLASARGAQVGISPQVRSLIATSSGEVDERRANYWLTFANEPVCGRELPANHRGLLTLVGGPREVNLDYYPGWAGDRHLVIVDLERLKRRGFCPSPSG